jgi:hypothetical protein
MVNSLESSEKRLLCYEERTPQRFSGQDTATKERDVRENCAHVTHQDGHFGEIFGRSI